MPRALLVLLALLLASSALSGCFGGDDDDGTDADDDGDKMTNGDGNNTTMPPEVPNLVPTAAISVSFDVEGNTSTGNRLQVPPGDVNVSILLDGSASTDDDGNITAYSWTITDPEGETYRNTAVAWQIDLTEAIYGGWIIELRALDDAGEVGAAVTGFTMDYARSFAFDVGLLGPANAKRDAPPVDRDTKHPVDETQPWATFQVHDFTLGEGATSATITVEFTGDGQLAAYVFEPGTTNTQTATPLHTADGGDSPITLTLDRTVLNETGRYVLRLDLDGNAIDSYTGTAVVQYAAPDLLGGASDGNGTADGSANNTTNGQQTSLPTPPTTPIDPWRDFLRRLL